MESLPAVLIVDDDRVVLHTVQDQLSRENYRVAAISNVAEALQRLASNVSELSWRINSCPKRPDSNFCGHAVILNRSVRG